MAAVQSLARVLRTTSPRRRVAAANWKRNSRIPLKRSQRSSPYERLL